MAPQAVFKQFGNHYINIHRVTLGDLILCLLLRCMQVVGVDLRGALAMPLLLR